MSIKIRGGLNMPYRVKMHTVPVIPPVTVDQLFRRSLITGNGSSQSVPSIDFTAGGLVMSKARNIASYYAPVFSNSIRGGSKQVYPNSNAAESSYPGVTGYSKTGFSLGSDVGYNENGRPYVFFANKVAPGFFFMKQYTGNGTTQQIAHGLGMAPGMFVIKRIDQAGDWYVWHSGLGSTKYLMMDSTNIAANCAAESWGNNVSVVNPDASHVFLGNSTSINANGATYMIYGWANNPAGFVQTGLTTTSASGLVTIPTGWTDGVQYLMYKKVKDYGNWNYIYPVAGKDFTGTMRYNIWNAVQAEGALTNTQSASGVITNQDGASTQQVIYMVIRAPKA